MEKPNLADLRRDYSLRELDESTVMLDPLEQFTSWFGEATNSAVIEPNAMTISTVGHEGIPSSRVVLLKGFDRSGFVFFTNYKSRKGTELIENPNACLHFFWPDLERQIIINGTSVKISREESQVYFDSRPLASRIGAWTSKQSRVIDSRKVLEEREAELTKKFGEDVPLPPFWGGFRVIPNRFEFWQGRPSRLHDRIVYDLIDNEWVIARLSP